MLSHGLLERDWRGLVRQFATQAYDAVVHYNAGEERAVQIPYMTGQLIGVDGGFTLPGNFPNREVFLQEGLRKRQSSS